LTFCGDLIWRVILSNRAWYWLGLLGCATLMAIAYFYFQQILGLAPCPLCMVQRGSLVVIGVFCLLGLLFKPKKIGSKALAFGVALSAAFGAAVAGRQVWLQHLPADQVPECGPDLAFMLDVFPLQDVISSVLKGSGECAEVQWQFLSFSMPEWMVIVFAIMLVIALKLLFAKERSYFSDSYSK